MPTKITYTCDESGFHHPNLAISPCEPQERIGKLGRIWKLYMMDHHPQTMIKLVMTGTVNQKISEMNNRMEDEKESLILQLLEATPFPDSDSFQIREANLKNIYNQAEELVLSEYLSATTETVANNTIYDQL